MGLPGGRAGDTMPRLVNSMCTSASMHLMPEPGLGHHHLMSLSNSRADQRPRTASRLNDPAVEAAGLGLEERYGSLWVYTVNFRKDDRAQQA